MLRINFKNLSASLILLLIVSFTSNIIQAQSMGISSTSITPDASSILELRTTTKGMLIPRMTTIQREAISSPAKSLMIYNTSTNQFNFYNGSTWVVLTSNTSTAYFSVDAGTSLSTSSTSDVVIPGISQTATESGS